MVKIYGSLWTAATRLVAVRDSVGRILRPAILPMAVVLAAGAGCGAARPTSAAGSEPGVGASAAQVRSNMLRTDYVGSERCASCHPDLHAAWASSPMHQMTRLPAEARIRAPFDGSRFHFKEDSARFTQLGGERFVELASPRFGDRRYRVTRVIGGRYREDFAGVEVGGSTDAELILPVSYVFETASFRLKGYSVLVGERPGLRAGGVWNQTCIFCHNTVPYFDAVWGALYGPGAPGYQGTVVDKILPSDRRWRFEVGAPEALTSAIATEVAAVGGRPPPANADPRTALGQGIRELRARFGGRHLVEVGIGCEACHGGGREHVANPRLRPTFLPETTFLTARPPSGPAPSRAEQINRVCARCHQVLFTHYPFTWEGGLRKSDAPGGSSITSGEGRDFLLGGCGRAMACTACHDPHGEDKRAALDRLATVAGNTVCTGCHAPLAAPAALRAHAHHDPAGAGASCVGCHMPRKNMGLGYALTRYHRIGRPNDRTRVERDRPLECALCHADKTVASLVDTMERWWGRTYDRGALRDLYGNLDVRPLEATLARGKAHEQATALGALAAMRYRGAVPAMARQLSHPYPLVRLYARRALAALNADCPVDLDGPISEIEAAVRRCVPDAFSSGGAAGAAPRADTPDDE
jgi:predicted CXXCH cytochrome family protein